MQSGTNAVLEPSTSPDAYQNFMPGGTTDAGHATQANIGWGFFNPTPEGTSRTGRPASILHLIQLIPGSGNGTDLGNFVAQRGWQHPDLHSAGPGHADADAHADSYGNADADPDRDANPAADSNSSADADADSDAHRNPSADPDPVPNPGRDPGPGREQRAFDHCSGW